nr:DUF4169 family protein [Marinicella sp. W31]MDC2877369.1 DUF4169 family protein [Marinicella sp. W31]
MSAEIVNLRLNRKRAERQKAAENAAENRAVHGRSKGEKQRDRLERAKSERLFEQGRIERIASNSKPGDGEAEDHKD